jgi:methionyl-tRNA synthetase
MKNFYLTAAIPYINAKPHLGHVLEWFQADSIARYHRSLGKTVSFTCGTDENSLKNVQAAEKIGKNPQEWLDEYATFFEDAFSYFDISLTHFRRGSDQLAHWPGVQELWNRCALLKNGDTESDIYQKEYTGLYCVGCESYYTFAELLDGKCPEHLTVPETITEKNYFFRLSKYQNQIRDLIVSDKLRIVSEQFKNEMLGFIDQGLEDFSVSRSKERGRGVGVPVPGDPTQVMYVWFDALAVYLTAIGFGINSETFNTNWPANVHVIGKGINRFHSVYWIGMLLSAGLATPEAISVHGYITADGQKMSKSLGNVIDPFAVVEKYGLEPIRYYLLRYIPTHADGDFSYEKFRDAYTADLSNGLGNLCSRVAKLCEKHAITTPVTVLDYTPAVVKALTALEVSEAITVIVQMVSQTDQYLSEQTPWKKEGAEQAKILREAVQNIRMIAYQLQPFMPKTAATILHHFNQEKITALAPLFPRFSE